MDGAVEIERWAVNIRRCAPGGIEEYAVLPYGEIPYE